jgi:hypothetical protein
MVRPEVRRRPHDRPPVLFVRATPVQNAKNAKNAEPRRAVARKSTAAANNHLCEGEPAKQKGLAEHLAVATIRRNSARQRPAQPAGTERKERRKRNRRDPAGLCLRRSFCSEARFAGLSRLSVTPLRVFALFAAFAFQDREGRVRVWPCPDARDQCATERRCSRSRSRPKSPLKSRHTEWMWLPSFWVLSYSTRNVGPCSR